MDCAAERHQLEPEPAEPAAWLCRPCRTRLSRHLRRLPGLYDELDVTPGRHARTRGQGDGLPYNDRVSECRDQIGHDLAWWTRTVATASRAPMPQLKVPAMAGYLHGHLTWLTLHDWAGDMASAIAHDHGRAVALLDPWPASIVRRREFVCQCGGQLVFTMYGDDDKRPSYAACQECEGRWDIGPEWMTLRKQMRTAA